MHFSVVTVALLVIASAAFSPPSAGGISCVESDARLQQQRVLTCNSLSQDNTTGCSTLTNATAHTDWPWQSVYMQVMRSVDATASAPTAAPAMPSSNLEQRRCVTVCRAYSRCSPSLTHA